MKQGSVKKHTHIYMYIYLYEGLLLAIALQTMSGKVQSVSHKQQVRSKKNTLINSKAGKYAGRNAQHVAETNKPMIKIEIDI